MVDFTDSWLTEVHKKNSIACAGMDPADYAMGRTEKGEGLLAGVDKRDWALTYLEAVAPHISAVKPNLRYWGRGGDLELVKEIVGTAKDLGLIVIQDSKEADIGSTNDSGIFYAASRGCDAVTVAAFAGNMQEAAKQAKDRGISAIHMCIMSNPDYEKVKNMWVDVSGSVNDYGPEHVKEIDGIPHVRHYIQLANDSRKFGFGGIVIGAPSAKNHVKDEEVGNAARYYGGDGLELVPGVGVQGGEEDILARHFKPDHLIINVGRVMMFPKGAKSTPQEQAEAAKFYQERFNKLRITS